MAANAYPVNQDCLDLIAQYAVDGSTEFMMWRSANKALATAAHTAVIAAARKDSEEKHGFNPRRTKLPKDPYADTDSDADSDDDGANSASSSDDDEDIEDWILAAWHIMWSKDEHDQALAAAARQGKMHLLVIKTDAMPAVEGQLRASTAKQNVRCVAVAAHNSAAHIVGLHIKDTELGSTLDHLEPLIRNYDHEVRGLEIR